MNNDLKTIKFQLMLSPAEAESIDDWGFKNRIRTRAEAMRRLCQIGLMFDDSREELIEKYNALFDKASEFIPLFEKVQLEGLQTEFERELLLQCVETFSKVSQLFKFVRTTTGLANNFKDSGPLEEIIAEAKKIRPSKRDHDNDGS